MKRLIFDLDDTLCFTEGGNYRQSRPNLEVIAKLRDYHAQGFTIVISSSRNMRTYEGNVGKINANTLPIIVEWLNKHEVPFDEIYIGKPWCGQQGFYIDDKAVRPDEFASKTYEEICSLVGISQ